MKRRTEKAKRVKGNKWAQLPKLKLNVPGPPCFVCGEDIVGRGVPLLVGHTAHTKTGLPTKIGQLMGEGFMVVVSMEDMLCRRCASLLNQLDKLEIDLDDVRVSLMRYLKVKYQLSDEYDTSPGYGENVCYTKITNNNSNSTQIKSEVSDGEQSFGIEGSAKDDASESEWEDGAATKKVNVEIILDDSHCQRNNLQESVSAEVLPTSKYECEKCGFGTDNFSEIQQHPGICSNFQHICRICGKRFETNRHVQNHIMQAHLSKWTCHFCNVTFSEEQDFTTHTQMHISDNNIENHVPLTNSAGNYECNICDFESADKAVFDDHIRKHVVLKLFRCKECGRRFENEVSLYEHCAENHSELGYSERTVLLVENSVKLTNAEPYHDMQESVESSNSLVWSANHSAGETSNKSIEKCDDIQKSSCEKDATIKFQTCSVCSLTFLNETLFEQHMKNHSSCTKNDILDAANSLMSSLVGTQNYVESVMGSSLEDMFEKMHAPLESSTNKSLENFLDIGVNCKEPFRCDGLLNVGPNLHGGSQKISEEDSNNDSTNCPILKESPDASVPESKMLLNENSFSSENSGARSISQPSSFCIKSGEYNKPDVHLGNMYNILTEKDTALNSTNGFLVASFDRGNDKSIENETNGPAGNCSSSNANSNASVEDSLEIVEKTYICAVCEYKCPDMSELKAHFREHRNRNVHQCTFCNKSFSTKLRLKRHVKIHENSLSGKMTCPTCYEEFPNYFQLLEHMQDKHQKEKVIYKCDFCNQKFTSRKAYKVHEEMHPERFEFKCDECSQTFMKEKQLRDHKDALHRDPHCRFCGKEIMKLKTLRNHELRHLRDKDNFECEVCKRVFKTKTGLRHHVAVHTGEYKYCCDYCGRGFMSRMMMEEHRSMHTKEERYVCDVCGRKFSFQSTYWIHRKWHDNPYPYKCSFCNRMFRHSSLLAVHKRKHTGERPYKCPHCPLTFPVGGTLKRHLILHTGVYPFNCESCKRGFTTRHKYATHLAKTHGDYELLNAKPPQAEYKMVIRDEPKEDTDLPMWHFADDSEQGEMNFKLEVASGSNSTNQIETGIPCSIVDDDLLTDSDIATRVVEIVLDDESQAVATVTLAEPNQSILPELWYQ